MGPHGRNRRVIEFSLCRPPSRPLARAAAARVMYAAPRPTHSLVDFLILVNTIKIDPARSRSLPSTVAVALTVASTTNL